MYYFIILDNDKIEQIFPLYEEKELKDFSLLNYNINNDKNEIETPLRSQIIRLQNLKEIVDDINKISQFFIIEDNIYQFSKKRKECNIKKIILMSSNKPKYSRYKYMYYYLLIEIFQNQK